MNVSGDYAWAEPPLWPNKRHGFVTRGCSFTRLDSALKAITPTLPLCARARVCVYPPSGIKDCALKGSSRVFIRSGRRNYEKRVLLPSILPPPRGKMRRILWIFRRNRKELEKGKERKELWREPVYLYTVSREEEFLPAACSLGWQGAKGRARRGTGMTYDPLTRCDLVAR